MKKIEKKVIFGTIPTTTKNDAAQQGEAAAEQATTDAQDPATEAQPEPETPDPAPAEETAADENSTDAADTPAEAVLKLSRRIEELEAQLQQQPQTIEERIVYFKHKQALTDRYEKFMEQVEMLDQVRKQVEEINGYAEDFSTDRRDYRLQIFPPYGTDAALSITNVALIDSVLVLLRERMLNKAAELQAEISA